MLRRELLKYISSIPFLGTVPKVVAKEIPKVPSVVAKKSSYQEKVGINNDPFKNYTGYHCSGVCSAEMLSDVSGWHLGE